MAEAMIAGIVRKQPLLPIRVYDVDASRMEWLEENHGVLPAATARDLCCDSSAVVLAVKPQVLPGLLRENAAWLGERLVISVAAGIRLERIAELLPASRLIRAMPNSPARIGQAASVLAARDTTPDDRSLAEELFGAIGSVRWLEEGLFDAVTALSGSGPAYVYLFIEALMEAAVAEGLPPGDARDLALDTVLGAAAMVRETGRTPAELREMVTSPGGTTVRALEELEACDFTGGVHRAVRAAAARSRELG